MNPIVGTRYSLRGGNYDLCEAEYRKLPEGEKAMYELVPSPQIILNIADDSADRAAAVASFAKFSK